MRKYLLIALLVFVSVAYGAGFDCLKASTLTEKTICSDRQLSLLDGLMGVDFRSKLKNSNDKSAIKEDQKKWNKLQRDKCGDNVSCLVSAYQERLDGSLDYDQMNAYLVNEGWKKGKYLTGSRFCSYEYIKGADKINVGVYCAGDAFNSLAYR